MMKILKNQREIRRSLNLMMIAMTCAMALISLTPLVRAQEVSTPQTPALTPPAQEVTSAMKQPEKPVSRARSKASLASRAEFDELARVYTDTPYALPHVMFVIDRQAKNKIYYVNSRRYKFHRDFVNGTYLSLERGDEFFQNNYIKPNRRFILGTVAYQTPVKGYAFEFWEGDMIPAEQIKLTHDIINRTFFDKVAFKPNSLRHEELTATMADLPRVLQSDITREQEYQPLNVTRGIGRIHIIDKLDDTVEIGSNEILVLNEVPITLPPVAGIISTKPSTPLSHINLLAKSWGVPNAYIKNAPELLRELDGWWVSFEAKQDSYSIKRADINQIKEYQNRIAQLQDVMKPQGDLSVTRIAGLREQQAKSIVAYGGKSANLGELIRARIPGIIVPDGWTIPFHYYDKFIKDNNLEERIYELLNDQNFVHNPAYRRQRLVELREQIKAGKMDAELEREVRRRMRVLHAGKGVFARSSSNTEDLPNFNGAGIYSSAPNLRTADQLIDGIKFVWASLWNFEAYEARERKGIDHTLSYMAVLIQEAVNADSAGVMITTDPYNKDNAGAIYISAKRGLGIRVVEGQKVAEQLLFSPKANAVSVLTRSTEDSLLTFDDKGGVREIAFDAKKERMVLTDVMVRRLSGAAARIKRVFGNREQDIEWVLMNNQVYIVQSRPYIAGS